MLSISVGGYLIDGIELIMNRRPERTTVRADKIFSRCDKMLNWKLRKT
jgi:hypothetical protein